MVDPKRLVEIEEEGHEPFRTWRKSDYEQSMEEGKRAIARVEKYLPEIWKKVDELQDYAISLFQSVIRTESVNAQAAGEKPLARLVESELKKNGFTTSTIEPEPNRMSVVGNKKLSEKQGPRILFYGHLDTVPAGNLAEWKYP